MRHRKNLNTLMIALCSLALIAIAAGMIMLTVSPAVTVTAHSPSLSYDWYYKPSSDGSQPICADNAPFISECENVFYIGEPDDMSIYLTFDVGYENGNTCAILDVLKEAHVPAAFFVTGHLVRTEPELIKRMSDEGHLVCNHTDNHKDLSAMSDIASFSTEVENLERAIEGATGAEAPMFMRPPQGKYSQRCIEYAGELGYDVVFWSLAYRDWINEDQPDPASSTELILQRTHPGAVVLLHSNSATNAKILPDVIAGWREKGYTLRSLNELKDRN